MPFSIRTDLADEARSFWLENAAGADTLPGVHAREETRQGFGVTRVEIRDKKASDELCKPIGEYVTLELGALLRREQDAFERAATLLSELMGDMLQLRPGDAVLVAGLGNRHITPDAIGPEAADYVLVTRHLKQRLPQQFDAFREVSVLRPGVLGNTGVETAETVAAMSACLAPDKLIVIDALASRHLDKLCRSVQLTDTGIIPGSGVGNHRAPLTRESLGLPVLALGVPTVVDAATLALELAGRAGVESLEPDRFGADGGMIVTPRDIDRSVHDVSKLIGYAINLALHPGLTVTDVDLFL